MLSSIAIASCYSPDTRDCTVSCSHPLDCASGQVCGADHFCASPAMAGRCGSDGPPTTTLPDAAIPPVDARPPPPDAGGVGPRPDAAVGVALQIEIMGGGSVVLDGVGTCTNNCTLYAPPAMLATLHAVPNPKQMFSAWTQGPCTGQGATCTFLPVTPVTIAVRFMKADG